MPELKKEKRKNMLQVERTEEASHEGCKTVECKNFSSYRLAHFVHLLQGKASSWLPFDYSTLCSFYSLCRDGQSGLVLMETMH